MTTVLPPSPVPAPQGVPASPAQGVPVQAELAALPPALAGTGRALTLRGEVQQANPDGTVRIATPRGPIDVKLPEGQTVARGQTVEVQIPAGSPPRTATVTVPQLPPASPAPQPQLPPVPVQQAPIPPPAAPPTSGGASAPQTAPQTALPTPPQPAPPVPVITRSGPASIPPASVPPAAPPASPQAPQPLPPAGAQAPAPSTSPAPANAAHGADVTPQGLLQFLRTSLQTFMKNAPVSPGVPANAAPDAQRPLQLGQMVRLTPLPAAAMPSAAPATTTAAPPVPPNIVVQGGPVLAPSLPGQNPPVTQASIIVLVPPATATGDGAPLQNLMALLNAQPVMAGGAQAAPAMNATDAIARLLLPFVTSPAPAATPGTQSPVLAQLPLAALLQKPAQGQPVPPATASGQPAPQAGPQPVLDVRVTGMFPMGTGAALPPGLAGAGTTTPVIFAAVTGQTPQGLPVVELPTFTVAADGTHKTAPTAMVLQFPARALTPATILRLDVLQTPQPASIAAASAAMGETITWDALEEIIRAPAAQSAAQTALQATLAAIPKPGGVAFSAPVLMFVAALRGGEITAWLGDKGVDAIRSAARRADALGRITADFSANMRRADDGGAPPSEWRSLTLPMIYGPEISRIHLHYRSGHEDDAANGPGKKTGTRFIMDLALTRMGPLQIDGFSVDRRLDVTLRSERPLSSGMREMMRTRYAEAVGGVGFSGQLNFSASRELFYDFDHARS